ncbi:hypothetical protein TRFO_15700 [Tritrichomonas foetus]|uniref:UBR-type domain-containing protein n=1 Tax=Tritrichomonas foetus TaxID=1144522 RepID=A0A1J4KRY9_9EUKA|nr:hypothetical protein TRFO_15700 [Tritrichomonas foetus]|eukprot:OHT14039.1 hypothetical protein TRFO_15700 [Tritrichomonas foetus]
MFQLREIQQLNLVPRRIFRVDETSSYEDIINSLFSLGTIDIQKINPDNIEGFPHIWTCYCAYGLNAFKSETKTADVKSVITFLYLGRTIGQLCVKFRSLSSTILSLIHAESIKVPDRFPDFNFSSPIYLTIPDVTKEFRIFNYLANLFNLKQFNCNHVMLWAAQLYIIEKKAMDLPNLEKFNKYPEAIPFLTVCSKNPKYYLHIALIRFLYNKLFKVHVEMMCKPGILSQEIIGQEDYEIPDQLTWKNATRKIFSSSESYFQYFAYSNDYPGIDFPSLMAYTSKIPIAAFTLMTLNMNFEPPADIEAAKALFIKNNSPFQALLILLIFAADSPSYQTLLESFISYAPENWSNAISLLSNNIALERCLLKSKNGNIKATKVLANFPDIKDLLDEKIPTHLYLITLFLDDIEVLQQKVNLLFDNIKINLENAILLYKFSEKKKTINSEQFEKLIKQCNRALLDEIYSITSQEECDFEWIMAGLSKRHLPFDLPKLSSDFIFDEKSKLLYVIFLIVYYSTKCVNKIPEIPEFCNFMTCSFTSHCLMESFGNSISKEYLKKNQMAQIENAYTNPNAFIQQIINNTKPDNESFSLIVDCLVKHDDYSMFLEIVSKNRTFLPMFVTSPFIKKYFKYIEQDPPSDIFPTMQQILSLNDPDMDVLAYKTLAAFAHSKPELALYLMSVLSIKKNFVEVIIDSIGDIPSPVPAPLLAFIKEAINKLPKVQCKASFSPAIPLDNYWNEDLINSSEDYVIKKKKTIWDYPDDPGECTQIVTGHNYVSQPWFYCHTCGLYDNNGACLSCAIRCHQGHDITFSKFSDFYCDCYDNPEICQYKKEREQADGRTTTTKNSTNSTSLREPRDLRELRENDTLPGFTFHFLGERNNPGGDGRAFSIHPSNYHTIISTRGNTLESNEGAIGFTAGPPPPYGNSTIARALGARTANGSTLNNIGFLASNVSNAFRFNGSSNNNNNNNYNNNNNNNNTSNNNNNNNNNGPTTTAANASTFTSNINGNNVNITTNGSPFGGFAFSNTPSNLFNQGAFSFSMHQPNEGSPFGNSNLGSNTQLRFSNKGSISQSQSKNSGSSQIYEEQIPLKVSTAIIMIDKISNVVAMPPKPLQSLMTEEFSFKNSFSSFNNVQPCQFAHFENTGDKCLEQIVVYSGLSSIPIMNIAAGGPDLKYIIACEGSRVKIFDSQTRSQLSCTEVHLKPIKVSVSPLDRTIFALASLNEVYVYSINENGTIEMNHKIELMLEEIGSTLYVVSIDWVPLEPLHLAVTTPSFVKVYDIPTDCISPLYCFNSIDRILSSTFVVYEEQTYLIASTHSCKLYYNKCNVDSGDGPVKLTSHIPISGDISGLRSMCVSYCEQWGILYVSASKSQLMIIRLTDVFRKNGTSHLPYHIKCTGQLESLEFIGVHPEIPSIHFLRDRITGDTVMLDYSDNTISAFTIESPVRSVHPGATSTFITKNDVILVANDGYFYRLVPGKFQSNVVMKLKRPSTNSSNSESSGNAGEVDGLTFDVPASFWISSHIETSHISVTEQSGRDISQILTRRRYIFNDRRSVKLIITSNDTKNVIVGFKLCFERRSSRHSPNSVKIFNRRYTSKVGYARDFCLPLKPNEVGYGKSYKIEIFANNGVNEISIDGIDVFVVDGATLNLKHKEKEIDWMSSATKLTDYIDVSEVKCTSDVDFIIQAISAANYEKENDEENLKKLFLWMYTDIKRSTACRRILLKSFSGNEEKFERACARAIKELCENEGPNNELKKIMWRDFALLSNENKKIVGHSIWKHYDSESGAFGFSSAFLLE